MFCIQLLLPLLVGFGMSDGTSTIKTANLSVHASDPHLNNDKFTLIVTAFSKDRLEFLYNALERYQMFPYDQLIDKIVVIWNNIYMAVPEQLKDQKNLIVLRNEVNSLNNRWILPTPHVKTGAIVMYDDDMMVRHEAFECMFRTWKQNPDRIISHYSRMIDTRNTSDPKYIYDQLYQFGATYNIGIRFIIVSTKFLVLYKNLTPEILNYITHGPGMCDDIIMNMITSAVTRKPPLRVMLPPKSVFSFDRCYNLRPGLGALPGRQKVRSVCTKQLLTYFDDPENVLIPTEELAYCPPLSTPPVEQDERAFQNIEISCHEQTKYFKKPTKEFVDAPSNLTTQVVSIGNVVRGLKNESFRIGIVSSEFWSLDFDGRLGGFGRAAYMTVKAFERAHNHNTDLIFLHASIYSSTEDINKACNYKFHYLHGVPLISKISDRKCYKEVLSKLALDMVITIEFRATYVAMIQNLPSSVAVVVWVHDPHTPEISQKIRENHIPTLNSSKAPLNVSPRSCVVKQELFFTDQVIFAVTTPSFVNLYPSAYNFKSLLNYQTPVLPYAMDALINPGDLSTLARPHSSPRVIFIGRLDAVKRPWLFAETARLLPDVEFILLGKAYSISDDIGFGFSEETKQPPNLKMMGHVEGSKKTELFTSSWLLVSTAIHEGLPLNYIEALTLSIPIVATFDPEKIVSRFGIYVGNHPENSGMAAVPHLAKAIRELIADDARRQSLGTAGKQWVHDKHSTETFMRGIQQIRRQVTVKEFAPLQMMKLARSVGICATFLDEEKDLSEWLEFHIEMGVNYFYLYHLDNHADPHRWREVLWPYVVSGQVKVHAQVLTYLGQKANRQSASLQSCYETYKHEVDWLAFIDIDEYIIPRNNAVLSVLLAAYEKESGLVLPWRTFGPMLKWPSKRPRITELFHATPYDQRGGVLPLMAGTLKLILNTHHAHADYCNFFNIGTMFPKDNRLIHYVHNCLYLAPTPPVDEHFIPVKNAWSLPDSHKATSDILQLNHYLFRSCAEFVDKKKKKLQSIIARYGANNIPKWFYPRLGDGLGKNLTEMCDVLLNFFNTTDRTARDVTPTLSEKARKEANSGLSLPKRQTCGNCSAHATCVDLLALPSHVTNKCVCHSDYVGDGTFCGNAVWTKTVSVFGNHSSAGLLPALGSKDARENPLYYMIGAPTGDTNATHWKTDKKSDSFILTFAVSDDGVARNVRRIVIYQPFYGSIEYIGYKPDKKNRKSTTHNDGDFLPINILSIIGKNFIDVLLSIPVEPPVNLTHIWIRCKKDVVPNAAPVSIAAVGLVLDPPTH